MTPRVALGIVLRVAAGLAAGVVGAFVTTLVVETTAPDLVPYSPFIAFVIVFGGFYKGVASARRHAMLLRKPAKP